MHEALDEPINILVNFNGTRVIPLFFKWRNKKYKIEKLNLVHKKRDGNDTIYYFNVSDNANYFKLSFSLKNMNWKIEELYYEG